MLKHFSPHTSLGMFYKLEMSYIIAAFIVCRCCIRTLFCYEVHCILASYAISSLGEKESCLLPLYCLLCAVWLLHVPFFDFSSWCRCFGLQFVIVAFPGHAHLLPYLSVVWSIFVLVAC